MLKSALARLRATAAATAALLAVSVGREGARKTPPAPGIVPAALPFLGWAPRIVPRSSGYTRRCGPHQGAQEMARRHRQIARGMLTASNGLVVV